MTYHKHCSYLEVLVIVRIYAEAGNQAVNHQVYICILIASWKRFAWVKQQILYNSEKQKHKSDTMIIIGYF